MLLNDVIYVLFLLDDVGIFRPLVVVDVSKAVAAIFLIVELPDDRAAVLSEFLFCELTRDVIVSIIILKLSRQPSIVLILIDANPPVQHLVVIFSVPKVHVEMPLDVFLPLFLIHLLLFNHCIFVSHRPLVALLVKVLVLEQMRVENAIKVLERLFILLLINYELAILVVLWLVHFDLQVQNLLGLGGGLGLKDRGHQPDFAWRLLYRAVGLLVELWGVIGVFVAWLIFWFFFGVLADFFDFNEVLVVIVRLLAVLRGHSLIVAGFGLHNRESSFLDNAALVRWQAQSIVD